MQKPLVSIVVPTYNQGHYLPVALDSVMFQDYPNLEIIISNFGSTDNTSKVIKEYVQAVSSDQVSYLKRFSAANGKDKFIREYENRYPQGRNLIVLDHPVNIGGTAAYNQGFKRASGKYCAYLVGDDYFLPTAISEMVEALEKSGADVVYADMFVCDDAGRIFQQLNKPDYSFEACLADWFHLGVCRLYKRSLHDRVGDYDTGYRNANDYDMFLRFAMAGCTFVHLPKVLYCTRKHDPNNQNEPANWRNNGYSNLLKESAVCAERAREFLKSQV